MSGHAVSMPVKRLPVLHWCLAGEQPPIAQAQRAEARAGCSHGGRRIVVRHACFAVPLGALLRDVVGPNLRQARVQGMLEDAQVRHGQAHTDRGSPIPVAAGPDIRLRAIQLVQGTIWPELGCAAGPPTVR